MIAAGVGLAVQYGVRIDLEHFDERPAFNSLVDSLFGRRTDQVPNVIVVQPMVGVYLQPWQNGAYRRLPGHWQNYGVSDGHEAFAHRGGDSANM